jgi:toxin ParE1/3/4
VRRVAWTESALGDLQGIRRYIGEFNPKAAQELAERLLDAADRLKSFAERGRPVAQGVRELIVVYPYIIRYRIDGDLVVIMRVRHGGQRP